MASRTSAFRGTFSQNARPYITLSPDAYVTLQGKTDVVGCGTCLRKVIFNDYVTSISTEASVDSPPGSATITLTVPDTDVNNFYVDGQFLIISMMEVEIYTKGYYLIGGIPQYYRCFWGLVQSVSESWENGSTTYTISCKDMLRWWELTNTTTQPGFIESFGSSTGNFAFWGNQYAGMNPYTIIISLARESMGDFSLTAGSFTSFLPEKGPEGGIISSYAKDVMAYWQLKFANIWSSLVVYGTSGQSYTFRGEAGTASPIQISAQLFQNEAKLTTVNQETNLFKINPSEIATFKTELNRAADFELFQNETQSKLSVANLCKEQASYEFYQDTTGDIIFKPPFYNLNVLPNKPVSWIQDFEIISENITESEAEVYTHITSSGNAFGGVMDWGLNDEITTPRSGVIDFHLLRRFGWRRLDYQCEWAGNPRKLFFHLLDYLDRVNSRRVSGTVTIPLRPELRMGFPIWFPKWDSFFYVSGISHQYSVGGQATTTLTLTAKRSKFIAPTNIGQLKQTGTKLVEETEFLTEAQKQAGQKPKKRKVPESTWSVNFPDRTGSTTGLTDTGGSPAVLRDKSGKLLGFPNAVMVFRSTHKGDVLAKIIEQGASGPGGQTASVNKSSKPAPDNQGKDWTYKNTVLNTFTELSNEKRSRLIARLRSNRYEAGVTNAGAYDYASDTSRTIKEMVLVPASSYSAGVGTGDTSQTSGDLAISIPDQKKRNDAANKNIADQKAVVTDLQIKYNAAAKAYNLANQILSSLKKSAAAKNVPLPQVQKAKNSNGQNPASPVAAPDSPEIANQAAQVKTTQVTMQDIGDQLTAAKTQLLAIQSNQGPTRLFSDMNLMIRPVSDEFGFEVIGHYRYGRSAFIDRGKIQIANTNTLQIANELSIQFAPQAGALTDSTPGSGPNMGPVSVDYAAMFESMQPDDYITGATFTGTSAQKGTNTQDIVTTSQQTYTNLVNANVGTGVYVDADALRHAKTLSEMTPTTNMFGTDGQDQKPCACFSGRTNWLSILPSAVLSELFNNSGLLVQNSGKEVLNSGAQPYPQYTEAVANIDKEIDASIVAYTTKINANKILTSDQKEEQIQAYTDTQNASRKQRTDATPKSPSSMDSIGASSSVFVGNPSTDNFLKVLSGYLTDKFTAEYQSNESREKHYTVQDKDVENLYAGPGTAPVTDDILGDPQNPLFSRAASGDPAALQALQNQANFNFGMSKGSDSKYQSTAVTAEHQYPTTGQIQPPAVIGVAQLYNTAPPNLIMPTPAQVAADTAKNPPIQAAAPLVDPSKLSKIRPSGVAAPGIIKTQKP